MKKQKSKKKNKIIALLILAVLSIILIWDNNRITVSEYTYESEKISGVMDGFTIVQVSDLHNKSFGKGQKRLIEKIRGLQPDMIVITGDIIDSNHFHIKPAIELIEGITQIAPVFYVTGNHEHWLEGRDESEFWNALSQTDMIVLNNQSEEIIVSESNSFYLLGLNDNSLRHNVLSELTKDLDKASLQILLAHEPQQIKEYSMEKVDLVLSGHAHGGQVWIPSVGGLVAPDQGFFPAYTKGTYQEADTTMIVSTGLGNSIIPLRIWNPPEIVVITLHAKN